MSKMITISHILVFFILSSAVDAQSSSPPVASLNASSIHRDPSFDPVLLTLVCVLLFAACVSIFLRHCSNMDLVAGGLSGANANCSSSGPQGIEPKLLNTFPILVYSAAVKHLKFGKTAVNECAVCLSEFGQHDTLRLLPKCNHVFHPQCIDAWLASHVTCPVCRSRLKPAAEEHDGGDNEIVIVIPDEVSAHQMFDESSASRVELNFGDLRSLGRSHSTGHSLGFGEIGGKDTADRYTPRILEHVKKQIPDNPGGMRRSASYDVISGRPGDPEK